MMMMMMMMMIMMMMLLLMIIVVDDVGYGATHDATSGQSTLVLFFDIFTCF
jgi:hypothetical protein